MGWLQKSIVDPLAAQLAPIIVDAVTAMVKQLVPEITAAITAVVEREIPIITSDVEHSIEAQIPHIVEGVIQAVTTVGVDLSQDAVHKVESVVPGLGQITDAVLGGIRGFFPHIGL
jgi:NAD(P)H-hydrate repair Nnr-like enzyme with NAD(P)H-hydrate epimerase domain